MTHGTSFRTLPAVAVAVATAVLPGRAWGVQRGSPVVPGIAVAVRARPGPDTVVYERRVTRDGQTTGAGTRTVVLRVIPGTDTPALLEVEQRFPGGGGTIVDTAVAELETLRAVAHRSHQPARTMRFTFHATRATGVVTSDSASRPEPVSQEIGGPVFDSNLLELVIAALPLAAGFTAELPFFIYERGGRVPMRVAVRERAPVGFPFLGSRDAWVVSLAVPGAPATIWVDSRTRAVLRARYDIAGRHTSFTDERVTPLLP
ncbi:MAG TPA: hypothetical protein VFN96_03980 [Gemmatimonadales bacterium]|nr:hypothetical protein [Gemmatimonadales bacterium]